MQFVANNYFNFKQFTIQQDRSAMKVTTDSCLFGAWVAEEVRNKKPEVSGQTPEACLPESILDIGAGTGLLSLMLAQKNNSSIDSVEIDDDAFIQASENIAASPWRDRINVVHTDIKDFNTPAPYDLIISNPPFYENEWLSVHSKRNRAHHGSELLLDELLSIIAAMLKPAGKFYLLLTFKRHEEIMNLLEQQKIFVSKKVLVRQSVDHHYFRFMIEAGFEKPIESKTTEIAIKKKNNEYTEEFTALLKDYYLYL